jgi:hypothetical protein
VKYDVARIARGPSIEPGQKARGWMSPHAYKCLPMVVANSFGWDVVLADEVVVDWNGGPLTSDVEAASGAESAFGLGTFTVDMGCVWHTPEGVQLMIGPVPNEDHPDWYALSAIVETDHFDYPWFLTVRLRRPGRYVLTAGTRVARLTPVRISDVSSAYPAFRKERDSEKEFREGMAAARSSSTAPWIRWYHERAKFPSLRTPPFADDTGAEPAASDVERLLEVGVLLIPRASTPCLAEVLLDSLAKHEPRRTDDEWDGRTYWFEFPHWVDWILQDCAKAAEKEFGAGPLVVRDAHCVSWPAGTEMEPHTDDAGGQYPWRQFAVVLYLNDDYEGGAVTFPDVGAAVEPAAGDVLVFPGGSMRHGVEPITAGTRYTLICWLEERK